MQLFQTIIFITWNAAIIIKYGMLPSMSDSHYALPKKYRGLFTLFIWALAVPMFFYSNQWYFLSGACICGTGAAAEFKIRFTKAGTVIKSITRKVHAWGVYVGIAFAFIGLCQAELWYVPALSFVGCLPFIKHKSAILLCEWVVIAAIITGLFIQY